jgi:hypothetical protein
VIRDEPVYVTSQDCLGKLVTSSYRVEQDGYVRIYLASESDAPATCDNLSVTLQPGSGVLVDELRLHPVGASMTTHTYIPQVGVHSQTDDNGKTSYYEYDDRQRLKLVRDQHRNLVKQYQYRMKDRDAPIWINTGNTRCEVGPDGPTGKISEEQKDVNPGHRVNGAAPTQWVTEVYYPADCPTCWGEGQKFVDGTCLQGRRVNDSSTPDRQGNYSCVYHYEFADGTISGSYTETNQFPCPSTSSGEN